MFQGLWCGQFVDGSSRKRVSMQIQQAQTKEVWSIHDPSKDKWECICDWLA